jgi:cytochrome P450
MPDRDPPAPPAPSSSDSTLPLPPRAGLPLVGALPGLARDALGYVLSARARHGDIYTLDLGITRCIALNHPRHAQHVLRDHPRRYIKGGPIWGAIRSIVGNGLPTSEGDFWLRQRRMIQPHFHRERITTLFDVMLKAIDESLESWDRAAESGEPFDSFHEFARLTMNVVVKTLFGADISPEAATQVSREFDYVVQHVLSSLFTSKLPQWMPAPGRSRFEQAMRNIDQIIFELIARRREKGSNSEGDLLGMLIDAVDDEGGRMTDHQLRDEAISLLLAGYETTSTALAFTCGSLAERQDLAQMVRDECDQVLGQSTPTLMHLPRLQKVLMVLQEGLRMYPPTYWVPRTAVEDDVIDGYRIPAGSMIGVMTYVIHRHPEFWEQPDQFDPWRFTPERSAGRHPLAWIPFGNGQRLCIGRDFALMEGQLVLTRLLSRFELEPVPGRPMEATVAGATRPRNGVWLRVRRRTPHATAKSA